MGVRTLQRGRYADVVRHPSSDAVMLLYEGSLEIRVADRTASFDAPRHVHVSAGIPYELRNVGTHNATFAFALCPPGPTESGVAHLQKGASGGATLLGVDKYDRFPDSGLVRGGMWFLEPGRSATYHSHDAAPEIFVFLKGRGNMTVEGETFAVQPGDVVYVAPEMKHGFLNGGPQRLDVWLTVTPNVTPSHTFYEQLPDGNWMRVTPRLDGRDSRPPSP